MRLIDAEALEKIIKERRTNIEKDHGIEVGFAVGMLLACEAIIEDAPTIEAKPVVHAHWKYEEGTGDFCSNCGEKAIEGRYAYQVLSSYCSFCGAQMDEEKTE